MTLRRCQPAIFHTGLLTRGPVLRRESKRYSMKRGGKQHTRGWGKKTPSYDALEDWAGLELNTGSCVFVKSRHRSEWDISWRTAVSDTMTDLIICRTSSFKFLVSDACTTVWQSEAVHSLFMTDDGTFITSLVSLPSFDRKQAKLDLDLFCSITHTVSTIGVPVLPVISKIDIQDVFYVP